MSNQINSYIYQFYGLNLQLNQPLPGLLSIGNTDSIDVKIELLGQQQEKLPWVEKIHWQPLPESPYQPSFSCGSGQHDGEDYYRLCYLNQLGSVEYIVNGSGTLVWGFWSHEALFMDAVSWLLGSVLGRLLRLRGCLALHASAIALEDEAIVFMGASGAGKSTTAAAFAQRGYPILGDDLAVFQVRQGQLWVQPGYPRLRLWSNAAKVLNGSVEGLTRVLASINKWYLDLDSNGQKQWRFQAQPLPLSKIYVLGERDSQLTQPTILPLSPSQALLNLIESGYSSSILPQELRRREFQQWSQLAQQTSVQKLLRPDNLAHLGQLCELILEDCQSISRPSVVCR